jgi:EAL domain-containing protein (putative c-di-GMP-specific phosphodiesterase class I)
MEILLKNISSFNINLNNYKESIKIDVTIGVSFEKEFAIEKSLMALRYAKKYKKSHMAYNTIIDSSQISKETIAWKNDIKIAIHNDKIIPVFQPIVDRDQNIIKHEILMRMEKETKVKTELISPFFFLNIAMKTKQYNYLTKIMAEKSFKIADKEDGDFSFNISFEDIIHEPTILMLKDQIAKYKIGHKLIFEIVESENIEDYEIVKNFISDFRELGVRIAIDDFGAGFSNFQHILEIEPDYLKLDGSMIKNIDKSKKSYEFVKSIVGLTKAIGIKTIAEFVHSKEVFEICYKLGVDEFQGYYFSPPIQEHEMVKQKCLI